MGKMALQSQKKNILVKLQLWVQRGGETPLLTREGTVNPKLSEADMKTLDPEHEVLIAQKDIEELQKSI